MCESTCGKRRAMSMGKKAEDKVNEHRNRSSFYLEIIGYGNITPLERPCYQERER